MDIWKKYKSPLGYETGNGGVDSFGVDHSGFTLRDEIEYQTAREERENQLIQNYNNQGITDNYPQYTTNFWGDAGNNYGFGSSNISKNIQNVTNRLNSGGFDNCLNNGHRINLNNYTTDTEGLISKHVGHSYNNSFNAYNRLNPVSPTLRATEEIAGTITAPNVSSYVMQNAYLSSPIYSASKATDYQIKSPSDFTSQSLQNTLEKMPSQTIQAINSYIPNAFTRYMASTLLHQNGEDKLQDIRQQDIHKRIFNGIDCGGMSAEFADKIAYTESRGGCRDNINGYGCVNNSGSAFGRYQMQPAALQDAGYMNDKRQFLPETGISNMQEFLNNPSAQEQAMCNYLDRIDRYNQNWNNYKYLGKNVQIGNLNVPITKDMMLAGTHREGARKLNEWLNDIKIQNQQLVRNPKNDRQDRKKRNITQRFEEILNHSK